MSLDSMRGSYGRCPPFVVAGLLVVCIILTFNWWSLSSQNYDLIKQLEELGEQLKISSEEQDLCVHQRLSVEGRVKNMEEELAQLRVHVEQQRTDNDELKKTLETKEEEMAQLRVHVEQQRTENDNLKKTIESKEEEVKKIKKEQDASLCNTELESLKKLSLSKDGTIASLKVEKKLLMSQLEDRKQELQQMRTALETANKQSSVSQPLPHPMLVPNKSSTASPPPKAVIDNGVSVGGDHERDGIQELDKAENEENNAGERGDETNIEEGAGDNGPDAVGEEPVARMEDNRL